MAVVGGVIWVINAILFFVQFFSQGAQAPNLRSVVEGYGEALIAAIVWILMLYAAGGVINLLLDIEANQRKTT